MNVKERKQGQKILAGIQDRYNRQESVLKIANEQHAILGNLLNQLARMYQEEKKPDDK